MLGGRQWPLARRQGEIRATMSPSLCCRKPLMNTRPAIDATCPAPIHALPSSCHATSSSHSIAAWNHFTIHATEEVILANARALVDTGLAEMGYDLVQLDAGSLVARDEDTGRLVPNTTLFPNGLRHLSDALRRMGLRFGMYTDISGHTCSFNPDTGSKGSYDIDAASFAEWGADYVKVRSPPPLAASLACSTAFPAHRGIFVVVVG